MQVPAELEQVQKMAQCHEATQKKEAFLKYCGNIAARQDKTLVQQVVKILENEKVRSFKDAAMKTSVEGEDRKLARALRASLAIVPARNSKKSTLDALKGTNGRAFRSPVTLVATLKLVDAEKFPDLAGGS